MAYHDVFAKGDVLFLLCVSNDRPRVAVNRDELEAFQKKPWDGRKVVALKSMAMDTEGELEDFLKFLEGNPDDRVQKHRWGWTIKPVDPTAAQERRSGAPAATAVTTGESLRSLLEQYPYLSGKKDQPQANPTINTVDRELQRAGLEISWTVRRAS